MFTGKPLLLAPMAGISDRPFRRLAKKFGADLTVTEMVSAQGIVHQDRRTTDLLDLGGEPGPVITQIFGRDPEILRAAAQQAMAYGPAAIDINMGCPVKKIVKNGAGAALLKDLRQIKKILQALSRPPAIPYTLKIRSGWDHDQLVAGQVITLAAEFGALAVCCHPRTAKMMFSGRADWDYLEKIAAAAPLPVIGSGDLTTPEAAAAARRRPGIAALMLGRGTWGRPWLFREVKEFLRTGRQLPPLAPREKLAIIEEHWRLLRQDKGEKIGFLLFRKHLAWYSHGLPGAAAFRRQLFATGSYPELAALTTAFFGGRS